MLCVMNASLTLWAFFCIACFIQTITHDGALAGSMVSALAEAALGGHADVVMLLLDANADLNFKSGVSSF